MNKREVRINRMNLFFLARKGKAAAGIYTTPHIPNGYPQPLLFDA
jgi:hypothetical protein